MKVLIDENLPPALAKALHALFSGDHEVIHLRARFGPGVSDREWIEELSAEGRWVVISGDRRITRNRVEYAAFRKSGSLVSFCPRVYTKLRSSNRWSASWRCGAQWKPNPDL